MNLNDPKDKAVADAWDRLNRAISAVSVAQPHSLGAAVNELLYTRSRVILALASAFSPGTTEDQTTYEKLDEVVDTPVPLGYANDIL